MTGAKPILTRLGNLLPTAGDGLRGNIDASEHIYNHSRYFDNLHAQKLGLMQDLLTGKVSVQ
jgi:hypothetical protein